MCLARPWISASIPCLRSSSCKISSHLRHVLLACAALGVQQLGDELVLVRLQVAEREVFELPLDLPDAQPRRQRRVDLHRLAGDAPLVLAASAPTACACCAAGRPA